MTFAGRSSANQTGTYGGLDRFFDEMNDKPPTINQIEMSEADIALAERAARRMGYTQTAYTSTSELWGLFCLADNSKHRKGCFIKTANFGLVFISDLDDLQFHDLADEQRKACDHTWGTDGFCIYCHNIHKADHNAKSTCSDGFKCVGRATP